MSGSNGHRAERDGCGCPPWVKMCGHLPDGRVLLVDDYRVDAAHVCGQQFFHRPLRFRVLLAVSYSPCSKWRGCDIPMQESDGNYFDTDDLPAAEAEFRRREAALLRRPPE